MTDNTSHTGGDWTTIDFMNLRLTQATKQQLSKLSRDLMHGLGPARQSRLLALVRGNALNYETGIYFPVGDHVKIPGKLPLQADLFARRALSFPDAPLPVCFFSNALLI